MKCHAERMGPRHAAPTPAELAPLMSGLSRPSRSIPYLVSRPEHIERLSAIAAPLGYQFVPIESLQALHEHLKEFPATMVWTDSHHPDGDWQDVLMVCRDRSEELPVVVLALSDSPTLWEQANEAGVAEFLALPVAAPEVRRCLLTLAAAAADPAVQHALPQKAAV